MHSRMFSIRAHNLRESIDYLVIVLFVMPFIQTSYQIFIPAVNTAVLVWKMAVIGVAILSTIGMSKKIDKVLFSAIICNLYMVIPTFLNNGYYVKFFGYFIDSVGFLIVIKYLTIRYKRVFLSATKFFCRLMMYINFILLLVYPRGIYVENNGYLETRYLFLGMDNQAAILLLTFIIIIYAIEKSEPCLPKISFYIDVAVFSISIVLVWCGNSIVGIMGFLGAMLFQKITKKKITINDSVKVLFFLFVFINLFQGFRLFSVFIVTLLGKDMTLSGRVMIWENGIKEWLKYPIFGHGYQTSEAFVSFSNISGYVRGAHNQILNILLHGGIVFLLCYVAMFRTVHKSAAAYKDNLFVNILTLGILSNFVMWTADTYGHLVSMYLLIGLLSYGKSCCLLKREGAVEK